MALHAAADRSGVFGGLRGRCASPSPARDDSPPTSAAHLASMLMGNGGEELGEDSHRGLRRRLTANHRGLFYTSGSVMEEAKGRRFAICARSHSSVGSGRSLPPSGTFHHSAATDTARRRRHGVNLSDVVKGLTPNLPPPLGKHPRYNAAGVVSPPSSEPFLRRLEEEFDLEFTFCGFKNVRVHIWGGGGGA